MSRDDPHFRLRVPIDLKAKIEAAAESSRRSMNAEIISRLESSFETSGGLELDASSVAELLGLVDRALASLGALARKKELQPELSAAGGYSIAYELSSFRRMLLEIQWRQDYDSDPRLQAEFPSREQYLTSKFLDFNEAVYEHGLSAGRTGNEPPLFVPRRK